MKFFRKQKIIAMILSIGLYSCGGDETNISTDLPNDSLFADISINQINNETATVSVLLAAGGEGGSGVTLVSDEQLEVTVNGTTNILTLAAGATQTNYVADIVLPATDQFVSVDLIRRNSANITGSEVTISPAFELQFTQPLIASSTSTITWQAEPSATMQFIVEVTCISTTNDMLVGTDIQSFTDAGQFEIDLNASIIDSLVNVDRQRNCSAVINATRESTGQLSSEFGSGGSIVARRIQVLENIVVNLAP